MMNDKISGGLELNKLAMEYKSSNNERSFEILWEKVKPFAFKMAYKYRNSIEEEEIEQIAMICLFDCCRYIKDQTNLLTFYGKILINRLYDVYNAPKKRGNDKLNKEAYSLDLTYDNNGNEYSAYNPAVEDDIFFKEDFYKQCKLADNEITLVELLSIGYKQKEIKEELHIYNQQYKRLLNNIRNKVLDNYYGTILK